MKILYAAKNALAMVVPTGPAHHLHEEGQVLRRSWNYCDVEVKCKVKPLSYVGHHIQLC